MEICSCANQSVRKLNVAAFSLLGLVAVGLGQYSKVSLPTYVIKNVTVVTMTETGEVIKGATVAIQDGRILSINGPAPRGAALIDGAGKWLIPGLADMHVHLPSAALVGKKRYPTQAPNVFFNTQDVMTPYVANGVTQILNMDSVPESVGQRNQVERGEVTGPHIALAALIDGGNGPGRRVANSSDARQAVRSILAEGYDFVKVYSGLSEESFFAAVDEANKYGVKTLGHIPSVFDGKLESVFIPNYSLVAHAEEFSKYSVELSEKDARSFAQMAKKNGAWVSPTLVAMRWIASETRSLDEMKASPYLKYVQPLLQSKWINANRYNRNSSVERANYFDRLVAFHEVLVRELRNAGVKMLAGSDALTSGVVPGFSLHEELELLQKAGLTPSETLASATRLPAVWLGTDGDRGTVEAGKRADLVLLDADPLVDIRNTRKISGVLVGGRWHDRRKLEGMLADLAARNEAGKAEFDWEKLQKGR